MNYQKTLWENNKTVVDAEKLNKVEDGLYDLTLASIESNKAIDKLNSDLGTKANINHTHNDLATSEDLNSALDALETLKAEIHQEFLKYFDDADIDENNMLNLYSNGQLIKSLQLPGRALAAVCGEVLCGEVVSGEGLSNARSYNPTIWQDGITPINAENLNKIESKLLELAEVLENLPTGSGGDVHIGNSEPINKSMLWVDTEDETIDEPITNNIIELFATALQDHSTKINELFYITDAYLDDGEFEDDSETENLDGGIF